MNENLRREIVNVLVRNETKATYTALAEIVGGLARGAMSGLLPTSNNRWITSENGMPTGYPDDLLDEQFLGLPCEIRNGAQLTDFLQQARRANLIPGDHTTLLAELREQAD